MRENCNLRERQGQEDIELGNVENYKREKMNGEVLWYRKESIISEQRSRVCTFVHLFHSNGNEAPAICQTLWVLKMLC